MFIRNSAAAAVAALSLAGNVNAFWRLECRGRAGVARLDPLVDEGKVGAHVHSIHGSSAFSESSDYDDLRAGDCTSCGVAEDKSAYWTPSLYFQYSNGSFDLVDQVGGMLAYYLLYPNDDNTTVSAFPEGFRMIAGDTNQRNFTLPIPDPPKSEWTGDAVTQSALAQKAIGFNCLNYDAAAEGSLYRHFLPDKDYLDANCLDGIRMELMFPSCWNGVDLDSDNHKDHVAYPDLVMTGTCPDGYSERLISLFYETIWATNDYIGVDGEFVISNGDPTGYGYHGDFMMGWEQELLQEAADTCTSSTGLQSDCALFTIQDADTYDSCSITLPDALVDEDVYGPMDALPGNNPIESGPAYVTPGASATTSAGSSSTTATSSASTTLAVVPSLSYSAGSTIVASLSQSYGLGGVFDAVSVSTSAAASSVTAASAAITSAPAAASSASEEFVSTAIWTSGQDAYEVFWVEETVTVTASATETASPYKKRADHRHAHARRAAH